MWTLALVVCVRRQRMNDHEPLNFQCETLISYRQLHSATLLLFPSASSLITEVK